MKAFSVLSALLASSAFASANPIQASGLFTRANAQKATCTTDDVDTVFAQTDVQNAINKFESYINQNSDTWPMAGKRTYPSRTTINKGPAVKNALENIPGCAAEGSSTLQWWEYPLLKGSTWNGGKETSQGPARIVLTVTDNGKDAKTRYTGITYCIPMAYTTKKATELQPCFDD